jgi:flagellar assembly protein FliH
MDQTHAFKPFAFGRDFDRNSVNSAQRKQVDPAQLAREQAQAEQERARMEAWAEGREAGLQEARGDIANAVLSAVDGLSAGLEAVEEWQGELRRQLTEQSQQLAVAIGEALAGHALADNLAAAAQEALVKVMRHVERGTEVTVIVNPVLVEAMQEHVERMQSGDRRKLSIVVVGSANTEPGDARFHWNAGHAEVDAAERKRLIAEELAAALASF